MLRATEVEEGEDKAPVLAPGHSFASINDKISGIVLKRPITIGWVFGFFVSFMFMQGVLLGATWLFAKGVGV